MGTEKGRIVRIKRKKINKYKEHSSEGVQSTQRSILKYNRREKNFQKFSSRVELYLGKPFYNNVHTFRNQYIISKRTLIEIVATMTFWQRDSFHG